MQPTLLRLMLLPPFIGMIAMALVAWYLAYPAMVQGVVERERQIFEQTGAAIAQELSDHDPRSSLSQVEVLDRAALRVAADHVLLVDEGGIVTYTNDILREGGALSEHAAVPEPIRIAVTTRSCGRGLALALGERLVAGCWPVTPGGKLYAGQTNIAGHVILARRIDWLMTQARADLLNQSLRLGGVLVMVVGLLIFLSVRLILDPVAQLGARLSRIGVDDHALHLPRAGGIREIREFTAVLRTAVFALRGRERELQAVLDTAVDGIVTINQDGIIQQANHAIARLFGYTVDQMIGQHIRILMTEADGAHHDEYMKAYLEGGPSRVIGRGREVVARRRDGSTFLAWLSIGRMELPSGLHFTGMVRDVTHERMAEFELHRLAHHDPDLGIFNRRSWEVETAGLLADCGGETGFWILQATVRNLDDLVVTFGPSVETDVMGAIHRRIQATLPRCEIMARLSRTELAYALPSPGGVPVPDAGALLAVTFRKGVDLGGVMVLPDLQFVITPQAQRFSGASDLLLAQNAGSAWAAETADHRASSVFTYDDHVASSIRDRTAIAAELPQAMAQGLLTPVFQPQIRLADGRVRGVETLVRWRGEGGRAGPSPAQFIPIAERIGLVGEIDRLVTARTMDLLSVGALGLPRDAVISINASVKELADPDWVDGLIDVVRSAQVQTARLEIEVTETAVIENLDRAAGVLAHLRSVGIKVAIDDFGAGFASLSYLKHLPADLIKIDQSFIRDLLESRRSRDIVAAVIDLAHKLGMEVVAEGVENAQTAAILAEIGCDIGQGWHFGRPMPAETLHKFMMDKRSAGVR